MSEIKEFYKEINYIKDYLIKLGPARRKEKLGEEKFIQAKLIYENYETYVENYSYKVEKAEISLEDSTLIQKYITKIQSDYSKIIQLLEESKQPTNPKMGSRTKFDLKTAVSLLPVMDDSERVTLQLIDAIELYETMVVDADIQTLINFVLKTRLSHSAKLRLSSRYTTVANMVDEMKKHLLTRKSDTTLQKRMQMARQGGKTIEQFGRELESLFVNLTISQANGNSEAYGILKPLNEKQAISNFVNGLRNDRLSTVVSARNYASLGEAIQGAKDEEFNMTPSSSEQMFTARGRRPNNTRFQYKKKIGGFTHPQGIASVTNNNYRKTYFRGRGSYRGNFRDGFRGSYGQNRQSYTSDNTKYNRSQKQHHVNVAKESGDMHDKQATSSCQQFFRD